MERLNWLPRKVISGCWHAAKELVFPLHCADCRQPCSGPDNQLVLCGPCQHSLLRHRTGHCPRCGLFSKLGTLPANCQQLVVPSDFPANCPGCSRHKFWFDATLAVGPYQDELREAVLRSKRPHEVAFTLALGVFMGQQLGPLFDDQEIDLITTTPTHWRRRLQRGPASTELLLAGLASQLDIPVTTGLLRCQRFTKKQGTLSSAERHRNVSNAFRVMSSPPVGNKHLLIVDDVMTSGATLNELARILRRAGVRRISNVVLARGHCSV